MGAPTRCFIHRKVEQPAIIPGVYGLLANPTGNVSQARNRVCTWTRTVLDTGGGYLADATILALVDTQEVKSIIFGVAEDDFGETCSLSRV